VREALKVTIPTFDVHRACYNLHKLFTFRIYQTSRSMIQLDSNIESAITIMASNAESNPDLDFVLAVLADADEFKANWKKTTVRLGFSRSDKP